MISKGKKIWLCFINLSKLLITLLTISTTSKYINFWLIAILKSNISKICLCKLMSQYKKNQTTSECFWLISNQLWPKNIKKLRITMMLWIVWKMHWMSLKVALFHPSSSTIKFIDITELSSTNSIKETSLGKLWNNLSELLKNLLSKAKIMSPVAIIAKTKHSRIVF